MPAGSQFESREAYYTTHFHELAHWAGAPTRLDRNLKGRFGDQSYAFEELIAESAAALICCATGVTPTPRKETAQYLNSWMRGMRDDKQAIVRAFNHAQRAADFILREAPEPEATRPPAEDPAQPFVNIHAALNCGGGLRPRASTGPCKPLLTSGGRS